jgi:thiosulfate/3-mercaptopyruvate sulfurtransferase
MLASTAKRSCIDWALTPSFWRGIGTFGWQDARVIAPVVDSSFLLSHPHAVVADVRWYLDGRSGHDAFRAGHLPGAVWIDLEAHLSGHGQPATAGRHPFPQPADFSAAMSAYGIGDDSVVVAYDDMGGMVAARLVVMLRMLGRDAALLDGGLAAWRAEGHPVNEGDGRVPEPATFTERQWPTHRLVDADTAAIHASTGGTVLDARAADRFTGENAAIDPRPGHLPGARNAPWQALLGPDSRMLPTLDLLAHYESVGVDPSASAKAICYCGSGVSACLNVLAMERLGFDAPRLFVASWSGWSADPDRPVETGPAR